MRWRQFFTPVKSVNAREAAQMAEAKDSRELLFLDVRQPNEYEEGHIPGAVLAPLPDLGAHLEKLDREKPTVVYCAIGGRSRVAAQMMAGQGFQDVYNMSGGFKAWNTRSAYGPEEQGMRLFSGEETPAEALLVAYAMEAGLREFYLDLKEKVSNTETKALFKKLATIETMHQSRIFDFYQDFVPEPVEKAAFEKQVDTDTLEGGMTTEAYLDIFRPDLESPVEVVELAMSIEAQAMDLYQRAGRKCEDEKSRAVFFQIAEEEKMHLKQLGELINQLTTKK